MDDNKHSKGAKNSDYPVSPEQQLENVSQPKHSKYSELDDILKEFIDRYSEVYYPNDWRRLKGVRIQEPIEYLETALTLYINKEKAKAELVGRIDTLKSVATGNIDAELAIKIYKDRLAQLEAQLAKDRSDSE